jgi:acetoin utilization deacetylase AcuC-like enzyme
MQEARLHPNASDEQPTRLNMSNLWVEESTAVLRRPSGKQAGNQAAMPMEQLTKHYCQMAYGSTLYNADALAKDPDLAAAHVRGPKSKQTAHSIHTARSAPFKWAHHP